MADSKVRRVGEAGLNGTHACMQLDPARTAHLLAFFLGYIPCALSWLLFNWPGHCELPGSVPHCSHF